MSNLSDELKKEIVKKLHSAFYDELGIYKHPIAPIKIRSSDFYHLFEDDEEIQDIVDGVFSMMRSPKTTFLDETVVLVESEILKIKEEMIRNNKFEEKIQRNHFYKQNYNSSNFTRAFDMLSIKYNLIEVKSGVYKYILPLDEIDNANKINDTQWFFKEDNTQFSEFLVKSEKIFVDKELFIIPIVHKITRGKKKGVYNHYILIDNCLQEIYQYTVSDFRYLERRSSLYKLPHNLFPKERAQLFVEHLVEKAPKMAYNNNIILKSIFKGKIGNFYRNKILIKR